MIKRTKQRQELLLKNKSPERGTNRDNISPARPLSSSISVKDHASQVVNESSSSRGSSNLKPSLSKKAEKENDAVDNLNMALAATRKQESLCDDGNRFLLHIFVLF